MSKKSIAGIVVLSLVTFIVTVIANIPARFALGYASMAVPDLAAAGVSGTVWQGSASNIVYSGKPAPVTLGKTQWQLKVLPLLTGKLGLELDARHEQQKIVANAMVTLPDQIELTDSEVNLPAELIRTYFPMPVIIEGRLGATIRDLAFDGQDFSRLNGALTWEDAAVDAGMGRQELGSYLAVMSLEGERKYLADISELKGNLDLAGTLRFDNSDRGYDAHITLNPNENVDQQLLMMLRQVGKGMDNGGIEIKYQGKL